MGESPAQPKFQPLKILWMAFVGAVGVYAILAYVLRLQTDSPHVFEDLTFMAPILGGTAAALTLFAFSGGRILVKMEYQAYCIVRWTMIESVGIFGLIMALLGAAATHSIVLFGWAVLSLFRLRPTPEDYQQFVAEWNKQQEQTTPRRQAA